MTMPDLTGQYVIVRTISAGVHAGILGGRDDGAVTLLGARRLWYWVTADKGISLSDVAVGGINAAKSKICAALERIDLLGAIEIIPATTTARDSIETADVYRAK
ncbi:hypothetical protein [uncultured Zoogloea sp.]|uniref:DUF6948 domain-containing protein n=1 Tax=uncultured Zoogloea sp. TaxID=160237 RepID=UPI00260FE505|nr:hypothetical protein [uncultured Zoogloea sp.]